MPLLLFVDSRMSFLRVPAEQSIQPKRLARVLIYSEAKGTRELHLPRRIYV